MPQLDEHLQMGQPTWGSFEQQERAAVFRSHNNMHGKAAIFRPLLFSQWMSLSLSPNMIHT